MKAAGAIIPTVKSYRARQGENKRKVVLLIPEC